RGLGFADPGGVRLVDEDPDLVAALEVEEFIIARREAQFAHLFLTVLRRGVAYMDGRVSGDRAVMLGLDLVPLADRVAVAGVRTGLLCAVIFVILGFDDLALAVDRADCGLGG